MATKWHLPDEDKARFVDALAEHLPALRAKAGISQGDLAHMVGISRQTYSAAEGGLRRLSWETCLALLFFFDCNRSTHEMLHSLGAYPTALAEHFNGGDLPPKSALLQLADRQELFALDEKALHTLRSVLLVEYARCTGMSDEQLLHILPQEL